MSWKTPLARFTLLSFMSSVLFYGIPFAYAVSLTPGADQTIELNGTATVFADVAGIDSSATALSTTVDWGDGSAVETVSNDWTAPGDADATMTGSHAYTAATGATDYTVTLCADDGLGNQCSTLMVHVTAIVVNPGADQMVQLGKTLTTTVDLQSIHSLTTGVVATVDYGEGAGAQSVTVDNWLGTSDTTATVTLSNTYAALGSYSVAICGADDFATTCNTMMVEVTTLTVDAGTDDTLSLTDVFTLTSSFDGIDPVATSLTTTVDWGDGSATESGTSDWTGTGSTTATLTGTHSYSAVGTYTVTVTVNDGATEVSDTLLVTLLSATSDMILTVTAPDVTLDSGDVLDFSVNATNAESDFITATVDFGDGYVETAEVSLLSPLTNTPYFEMVLGGSTGAYEASLIFIDSYIYAADGQYTVQICFNDTFADVCSDLEVTVGLAFTEFPTDQTLALADTLTVEAQAEVYDSASTLLTSSIDFGDGSTEVLTVDLASGATSTTSSSGHVTVTADTTARTIHLAASHVYSTPAPYVVEICMNDGVHAELCDTFNARVGAWVTMSSMGDSTLTLGGPLGYTASGTHTVLSATTYDWSVNFGDGTTSSSTLDVLTEGTTETVDEITFSAVSGVIAVSGNHTYAAAGSYTAEVCVTYATYEACDSSLITVNAATSGGGGGGSSSGGSSGGGGGGLSDSRQDSVESGSSSVILSSDDEEDVEYDDLADLIRDDLDSDCEDAFADTDGHYAAGSICVLYEDGIVDGKSEDSFQPNRVITRAEFLKMILNYAGIDVDGVEGVRYSDVSQDSWYYEYIGYATSIGLIQGYPDGTFKPNQGIRRIEALSMLLRTEDAVKKYDADEKTGLMDVDPSAWYSDLVFTALELGLMEAYSNDSFQIRKSLTRAETVVLLRKAQYVFGR